MKFTIRVSPQSHWTDDTEIARRWLPSAATKADMKAVAAFIGALADEPLSKGEYVIGCFTVTIEELPDETQLRR